MLRFRRPLRVVAAAFVLLGAVLGVCHATAQPVTARPVAVQSVPAGSVAAKPALARPASARPVPATMLAANSPSGGLCSVPGIGDIGGLLGFCSLGSSGLTGDLNSVCQPGVPQPESATTGVNGLISPPAAPGRPVATPYNQYGMAGQFWAATNLNCTDITSLIGNDVAGMIFDFAKALDRVTITIYQSAAGEGILGWLQNVTDHLISGLGKAIYFPYLAVVVILAAIWLAWQGLLRKRATRTVEGTIWMIIACVAAVWLIGRPSDFTGVGKGVSDGISTALNSAFAHLPGPAQASCLPVGAHDPQISQTNFSYTSGRTVVDQNANELWTVLVCKPWLDGEFGTTAYATHGGKPTAVNAYARQLLWAQAIAANERPTTSLISAKQAAYTGIAQTIQQRDPGLYPLFQGKEWTTRLEIAFSALLAAVIAGVLVLLISVTLILLKLGFLLLLIVGPFFLLIGIHPGFGRVVAVRWFEMLIGVLLKQAAVALALSVLLYCYALIMGTSDAVLPWALKILMITLVTVAVFIYRKPFQHLFAAVGYGAIGSTERAEADLSRAAATARANTLSAATLAVPGVAAFRAARWARRNPAQAAGLALGAATAVSTTGLAATASGAGGTADGREHATGGTGGGSLDGTGTGTSAGVGARARAWGASAGTASTRQPPPLRLPPKQGAPASWPRGASPPGRATWPGGGGAGRSGGAAAPPGPSAPALPMTRSPGPTGAGGSPPRASAPPPPRSAPRAAPGGRPAGSAPQGPPPAQGSKPGPPPRQREVGRAGPGQPSRDGRQGRAGRRDRQDRSGWSGPTRGSGRAPSDSAGSGWLGEPGSPFSRSGDAVDDGQVGPFWLRPMRRRK